MKIDGQCHCGHVTFEADVDPDEVSVCHCTDCQVLTGSVYRVTVAAARHNVRLTSNQPKLYTKVADNGRKRLQLFCPACGTPLFTAGEGEDADAWGIRWGSIRQRGQLVPKRQIWCRSAVPWIDRVTGLPGEPGD